MREQCAADLWIHGFQELDCTSMRDTRGGGGILDRALDLVTDGMRHAGGCISNNWNKFRECYRKEMNK